MESYTFTTPTCRQKRCIYMGLDAPGAVQPLTMLFSNLLLATVAAAGIVHLPLRVRNVADAPEIAQHLAARGILHATQTMGQSFYETEIEVGTPPQNVTVIFDTGSPQVWLPGSNTTACETHKNCRSSFDVSKSSTWRYKSHGPDAGWGGEGNNGLDTFSFLGQTIEDFHIWVATSRPSFNIGVFGQSANDNPKVNFVQALADSGKISRAVYSLNAEKPIDPENRKTEGVVNNVYYGGFDRAKYQGALTTVHVDHHGGYAMPLGGLSIQGEKVPLTREHQIVLDTGGTSSSYTNGTIKTISQKFGGNGHFEDGAWSIACDAKPELTYEWGNTKIDVDMAPYIRKRARGDCYLGGLGLNHDDQQILLTGPPLISRALVIYDNTRDTITLAKAKYTDESDVVELTGDVPGAEIYQNTAIPSSTLAVKAASTQA
ncbi:aspartic peptidase domain-containing protein [Yarrowia lipolytica]|uniref:Peptidase A1 domain-containing protein n=1 Tax=Yarrowia lipolytica TaxID=4952 RepID=A0A1D8NAX6_YARLL|nr:hypothetical protein YALI1_C18099g [Yarrowia lipolytica]KAB8282362.1 aspartic peptidase domain-containing protein [Yarrowia lipolytica]KAE8171736.1 aspartic peptidase domain-containing protein [Yarrowia lipolytica]KAJ8053399.1 aspartic peptidase domain-containing protein [Yarrowia lipolytica]RMI95312.1 aspartic peptidase domain-containing protein [Yarrowia lipolytica]